MTAPAAPEPVALTGRDWGMLVAVALMWASSYLFIKIGLEDFPPATIAWLRIALGALALTLVPAARAPLRHREDWRLTAILGVVWMAVPFVLFTLAQQHIASALAGMINGAAPLFTAAVAAVWWRRSPDRRLLIGLAVGFVGVVALGVPNVDGSASLTGILMVLAATLLYAIAFNISGHLQARNGALAVIWRAQLVALVVVAPFGVPGLLDSTPTVGGWAAMIALGALGTGLAFVMFVTLVGRIGASRASITNYLIPVVALALGAGLVGERVAPLSMLGIVLALAGAYVANSRRRT
ncbi:EamA family transporter [Ornithinimicrobium ciconiae]|uniref:EamA family transporter n=1 Tax=Ornithinimicrobium ciconiae TaxID=2594265 RepID=A0A516G9J2_9MICO|nr:EamA family transporter [Ornithinimicrobium ciconiae]QDO88188.1 EamA family transporter [Ornithinimicrobium ciconiae]